MSSRTNKQVQPFTPVPDAETDLPNFDQWTNPAIESPVSSQKVPAIIDDELDCGSPPHIVALLAICTDSTMAQTGVSGPVVVDGESFLDALFASAGQG